LILCFDGAGPTIYVKEAWFGSKDHNCLINVTKIVDHDCTGFNFCAISGSLGKYGDPKCPSGVARQLTFIYWCWRQGI